MKINVLGGGPSGLYFAYLARKGLRDVNINVFERNAPDATFGFGVVLAGAGLARLEKADSDSYNRLTQISKRLGNQEIILNGQSVQIGGQVYGVAVERIRLLNVLQELCHQVGVNVTYHKNVIDPKELEDADLVVGADGAHSTLRQTYEQEFGTHSSQLSNAFAWYGAKLLHDRPTLSFRNAGGGAFCAHYYPYTDEMCTFVMECDRDAWNGCGFDKMTDDDRQDFVQDLFKEDLKGTALVSNKSEWRNFHPISNENWIYGKRVLIGDAVRRAHFSIGSGTRIAMEDSIALVQALAGSSDVPTALQAYVNARKPAANKLLNAARESYIWYEDMGKHMEAGGPYAFAFDYLTRTSRVDEKRVAEDFPEFMKAFEAKSARVF